MKGNISKNLDRDTQTCRKRSVVISIIIVLLILLFVTIFIVSNNSPNDGSYRPTLPDINLNADDGYTQDQAQRGIKLMAVTGLTFKEGSLEQSVDIPNVSSNEYAFIISIYLADGTEVFKSDYVYPGDTLTSIKLTTELKSGTYKNAVMLYRCYTTDTSHIAVSQCEFPIEIKCN